MSSLAQGNPSGKSSAVVALGDILAPPTGDAPSIFTRFWQLGYRRLVPIIPPGAPISEKSTIYKRLAAGRDDRGKTPGIQNAIGLWRGYDWLRSETTEDALNDWHRMGAGVGIKTGDLGDGFSLVVIDADASNAEHAAIIDGVLTHRFGPLPVRIGRRPKAAFVARVQGELAYHRIEFGERDDRGRLLDRVEILSDGRQFVAHGIHPKTNRPYEWPDGIPALADVPILEATEILAALQELSTLLPQATDVKKEGGSGSEVAANQDSLRGDPDLVRRAVEAMPNKLECDRDFYVSVGYAIRGAMGPENEVEAAEIFADWAARWDGAGEEDSPAKLAETARADFQRSKGPFKIGAAWLFRQAEELSGGQFSRAEQWFDAEAGKAAVIESEKAASAAAGRFAFEDFDDLAADATGQTALPLVKGLLDQGAMSVLYGESNSGKTFVMLDLAFHVATGRSWSGLKTTPMLVVYVAAEGGRGFAKRVAALKSRYGSSSAVDLKVLRSQIDLLRAEADLKPLIAALRGLGRPIGFLVIDTLSRAMAGGDENSSVDMGATVKHLDALRAATGAHLAVVHHSGKNPAKGARGHSLLRAATDTEIEIADGEIIVTKQRDLERSFRKSFVLDDVTLGVDEDGDPVTSATVRVLDRSDDDQAQPPTAEETERRERVARAACRALKGQTTAKLAGLLSTLTVELKRESVISGASLPTVRTLLVAALGDGVEVELDGQVVRMEIRQEGSGSKAPWMIIASKVPRELKINVGESGSDNLSDEFLADEKLESGGVFG